MIMTKMVDGVEVELSAEEVSERAAEETAWSAGEARRASLAAIAALEATVTPRRLREAALSDAGKSWLADVDTRIAALRASL